MSYIINKTDGAVVTEIIDGLVDQASTSLTLVGKNVSSYGEFLNENFVYLLENFANTSSPAQPITGQLWYDTSEGRLKVYDGNGFKVSGGTVVSSIIPSNLVQGDIWINSSSQQMYFNDGNDTILAGPIYTAQQGKSGFEVVDVIDSNEINRTLVIMWCNQAVLGVYSKIAFTLPANSLPGFSPTAIKVGFTGNSNDSQIFDVLVSTANGLLAQDDSVKTAEDFVLRTENSSIYGSLSILNNTPLYLGGASETELKVNSSIIQFNSNVSNQNFGINVISDSSFLPAFRIVTQSRQVGIFTDLPTATLDVNGGVRIRGDLAVEGNLTTITTTNVEIKDKLIEIAKVESPSNTTANGAGILVSAGTDIDKTLVWQSATGAWTSSENINLAATKGYYIADQAVLTSNSLGVSIASAPGLTSIGNLTTLRAGSLSINSNIISFVESAPGDGDIVLLPKIGGSVNVSNYRVTNVADPVNPTDAVNVSYLTDTLKSVTLGLYADTTGLDENDIADDIIEKIYPAAEYNIGTICRIYCVAGAIRQAKEFEIYPGPTWTFTGNL